jgi:small subunit ribosomal protein S16
MIKIRLRRTGGRNTVAYRVVVSDSRQTPRAAALEEIGYYDPSRKDAFSVDRGRFDYWVGTGAEVTPTVRRLLKNAG